MRRDLGLTDEEFINLLKEYVSKRGIKAMFENANLVKDEQILSDNYFFKNTHSLLLNEDTYQKQIPAKTKPVVNMKNSIETPSNIMTNFKSIIKPYTYTETQDSNDLQYLFEKCTDKPFGF